MKMNGHIGSYELETLFNWLLEDEKERKEAVLSWTSGLARQFGYIIERYYQQVKKPDYPKYKEIFSTKPFICLNCLKEYEIKDLTKKSDRKIKPLKNKTRV